MLKYQCGICHLSFLWHRVCFTHRNWYLTRCYDRTQTSNCCRTVWSYWLNVVQFIELCFVWALVVLKSEPFLWQWIPIQVWCENCLTTTRNTNTNDGFSLSAIALVSLVGPFTSWSSISSPGFLLYSFQYRRLLLLKA